MAQLSTIGRRVLLVSLLLLLSVGVSGTESGTVSVAQDQTRPTFRTSATVVTLTATVTDGEGKSVPGLAAADFELFDEGRRQRIVVFDAISRPTVELRDPQRDDWIPVFDVATNTPAPASGRAFVFVVDPGEIVLYQRVLTKLFSLLTPDDRVAVVFPRRSDLSIDFTSDPVRVRRVIERLQDAADGGNDFRFTRMALENAMVLLEAVPMARKAIVWVSGGFAIKLLPSGRDVNDPLTLVNPLRLAKDRGAASEAIDLFNKGERLGIPIYTIDPFGLYPEASTRTEFLKTASVATGGISYVNRAFVVEAAQELMTSFDHFYVLGFAPDPYKPDGRFRQIRLRVAGRPGLRVRTRAGYVAKAPPPPRADPTEALTAELAAGSTLEQLGVRALVVPLATSPSKRTRLLLTTSVEYPDGSDVSARRDDVLTLVVLALDPDTRVRASRQQKIRVPLSALSDHVRTVTLNEHFDLPRGPVVLRIGAASTALKAVGTVSLSVDVPRYQNTSPALSPLVLGLDDRSWQPPDSAAADLPFQPSTMREFPRDSRVQVFARGFGLSHDSVEKAVFSMISEGVPVRTLPATARPAPSGQAGTDFSASIPLEGLRVGTYAISLVVPTATGKPVSQAVRIKIQ